jgi:ELWxxDGT repeat protein
MQVKRTARRLFTAGSVALALSATPMMMDAAAAPQLQAQILSDICIGPCSSDPSAGPFDAGSFLKVGATMYFSAKTTTTGYELWKSDGTTAGTTLVRRINFDNSCGSRLTCGAAPDELTNVGGRVFFTAHVNDGIGRQVYVSDGTFAGTRMVRQLMGGCFESGNTMLCQDASPRSLTDVNGTVFFVAWTGAETWTLWKTDGTQEGTVQVKAFCQCQDTIPTALTNMNGTLYFTADDGLHGMELWKSDGTTTGTVMVKDINPVPCADALVSCESFPYFLTNVNGTLYFAAADPFNGRELWKSDGTEAGTGLVKDINTTTCEPTGFLTVCGSYPVRLTNANGTLYFTRNDGTAGEQLWKSDGTEAGTVLVKQIGSTIYGVQSYTVVNGTLYFTANDGTRGRELWRTDGTEVGTVVVKDINPGPAASYPQSLVGAGKALYFVADDGVYGAEIWKSDGTAAGTVRTTDICTASCEFHPYKTRPGSLTYVDKHLYFSAFDDVNWTELWRTVSAVG